MAAAKKPAAPKAVPAPKFIVLPAGVRIEHEGDTFGLALNCDNDIVLSGFNDELYLDRQEVEILHALTVAYLAQTKAA